MAIPSKKLIASCIYQAAGNFSFAKNKTHPQNPALFASMWVLKNTPLNLLPV